MTLVEYSESLKRSLEDFSKQDKKIITPELNSIIENISKTGITCYPWVSLKELFHFKLTEILDIFEKDTTATVTSPTTNITTTSSSSTNSPSSSPSINNNSNNINSNSNNNNNNVNSKEEEMAKIKNQVNLSGLVKMKKEFLDSFKESKLSPFTIQRLCELIINYKMYTSFSKYLCAVEKMLNVSTLPHLSPEEVIEYNKNQNSGLSRLTNTTTTTSSAADNFQPNLEGYAFSSSFTTSFPTTTTTTSSTSSESSTLSTDQEMKDIDEKEDDNKEKETTKPKLEESK